MSKSLLERQFEAAGAHMRNSESLERALEVQQKLNLYGIFKQATKGDCTDPPPSTSAKENRKAFLKWQVRPSSRHREGRHCEQKPNSAPVAVPTTERLGTAAKE
eukprot:scaffold3687_cov240-Pinguiococcus_pyrenoidosus.AAC.6